MRVQGMYIKKKYCFFYLVSLFNIYIYRVLVFLYEDEFKTKQK